MNVNDTSRPASSSASGLGLSLVALQFVALAALGWQGLWALLQGHFPAPAWGLALAGVALGAWALRCNRPGNFNIRPEPREGGVLVRNGPYRWIRHPMYSAVLVCGAACAWADGSARAWSTLFALFIVLLVKAWVEEHALQQRYPDYAAYRERTRRFVPWVI